MRICGLYNSIIGKKVNKNLNLTVGSGHLGDVQHRHQCRTQKDLHSVENLVKLLLPELDKVKMTQEARSHQLPESRVNKNVVQDRVQDVAQRKRAVNVVRQKNCSLWTHNLLL